MLGTGHTIVVCTMTAVILLGRLDVTGSGRRRADGAVLTSTGFQTSIAGGQYILTVGPGDRGGRPTDFRG